MRAFIGYARETINPLDSLRHYLSPGSYRPTLKLTPNTFNNVGRVCTIGIGGREWRITNEMVDQEFHRYCLVKNIYTSEQRVVSYSVVGNLY